MDRKLQSIWQKNVLNGVKMNQFAITWKTEEKPQKKTKRSVAELKEEEKEVKQNFF